MHHLDRLISELQPIPHEKLVIDFLYDGSVPMKDLYVRVSPSTRVPLLEALGMYMKARREEGLTPEGEIRESNRLLDLSGALSLLHALMEAAGPVRDESKELLGRAATELLPVADEAATRWN